MFLFFKTQKRDHTVSENIQSNVLFKVLITNAGPCGYFKAFSKKHLRYSLFVKRIIAIEAQLYFFGLGQTIEWRFNISIGVSSDHSQLRCTGLLEVISMRAINWISQYTSRSKAIKWTSVLISVA